MHPYVSDLLYQAVVQAVRLGKFLAGAISVYFEGLLIYK
jgi:hypothetical protein